MVAAVAGPTVLVVVDEVDEMAVVDEVDEVEVGATVDDVDVDDVEVEDEVVGAT